MSTGPSPLEQFAIKRLYEVHIGGIDVSITNSSVFMVVAIALVTSFLTFGMRQHALVRPTLPDLLQDSAGDQLLPIGARQRLEEGDRGGDR